MVVVEAAALARVAKFHVWSALGWSFLANVVSSIFGVLFILVPLILLLATPLWYPLSFWFGDLNNPVNRIIAVNCSFCLVSTAIEMVVYRLGGTGKSLETRLTESLDKLKGVRYSAMESAKPNRRPLWKAAFLGNVLSHLIAIGCLLISEEPYRQTTKWQWVTRNRYQANKALDAYVADHGGKLPPCDRRYDLNHALLPYFRKDGFAILHKDKVVFYDRPRLRGDWPELQMDLRKHERRLGPYYARDLPVEVYAPQLEKVPLSGS